MLVNGIDKVLGDNVGAHLKATYIGIELRTHILACEIAGGTQFTGYHTAMLTQGGEDDILDGAFLWNGVLAAPPVVEVGPPLATDKACLACKELAIETSTFTYNGAFPLPQRPFPCAIGEL